jgi:hypothetical protein
MSTPLIRRPQTQGSTVYAFASAAKDLTRTHNNPDLKFEFSRFALLNLPEDTSVNGYNSMNFGLLETISGPNYSASDPNLDFPITLQNYALNLEQHVLQDDDFHPELFQSDSEKIFFKWLHSIDAIRFKPSDSSESALGLSRFTEEFDSISSGAAYDRVVKYIGTIDATNDVMYKGNAYQEIYINVPTSHGSTPTILFKSSGDLAYNTTATEYDVSAEPQILGRGNSNHPDPLISLDTICDSTAGVGKYDIDPNTSPIYGIDWTPNSYSSIINDSTIQSISDFNQRGTDFKFNAILVYYDVFSLSAPSNRATNLYGIIILDSFTDGSIPTQQKYKPNSVSGLNGNAYSYKLNMRYNSSLDNVGSDVVVNDFTTFSMDIFLDSVSALDNATKSLLSANDRITEALVKYEALESFVLSMDQISQFSTELKDLQEQFVAANANFSNNTALLDLIAETNSRINQIINGTIPTSVQYNTDVVKNGRGIVVDRIGGKIYVNNNVNGYSLVQPYNYDVNTLVKTTQITDSVPYNPNNATSTGIWAKLENFENMVRVSVNSNPAVNEVYIYIDDTATTWKKGQALKLIFNNNIDLNGNAMVLDLNMNANILIPAASFISTKPYIEIVCVDPNANSINQKFKYDILR